MKFPSQIIFEMHPLIDSVYLKLDQFTLKYENIRRIYTKLWTQESSPSSQLLLEGL